MPKGTYRYVKIEKMKKGEEQAVRIKLKKKKNNQIIMDLGIYGEKKKQIGFEEKGRIIIKERGKGNRMKRPEVMVFKVLRILGYWGFEPWVFEDLFFDGVLWGSVARVSDDLWVLDVFGRGFDGLGRVKWYDSWSRIGRAFGSGWAFLVGDVVKLDVGLPFRFGKVRVGDGLDLFLSAGRGGDFVGVVPVDLLEGSLVWRVFGDDFLAGRRVSVDVFGSLPVRVLFQSVRYV